MGFRSLGYLCLFIFVLSASLIFEKVLSKQYLQTAKDKIASLKNLKVIAIAEALGKPAPKISCFKSYKPHSTRM